VVASWPCNLHAFHTSFQKPCDVASHRESGYERRPSSNHRSVLCPSCACHHVCSPGKPPPGILWGLISLAEGGADRTIHKSVRTARISRVSAPWWGCHSGCTALGASSSRCCSLISCSDEDHTGKPVTVGVPELAGVTAPLRGFHRGEWPGSSQRRCSGAATCPPPPSCCLSGSAASLVRMAGMAPAASPTPEYLMAITVSAVSQKQVRERHQPQFQAAALEGKARHWGDFMM